MQTTRESEWTIHGWQVSLPDLAIEHVSVWAKFEGDAAGAVALLDELREKGHDAEVGRLTASSRPEITYQVADVHVRIELAKIEDPERVQHDEEALLREAANA